MAIVKWSDPFEEMERFFDLRPLSASHLMPAIDVYEDDNHVYVEASLPGIDEKDIEISVENDILSIEGKSEKKSEVDEKEYYRKEVRSGSFHRQVALPHSVEGDKAKAEYKKGILKVSLPKREANKPTSIKIAVNK
jgi:HSP20 family protein